MVFQHLGRWPPRSRWTMPAMPSLTLAKKPQRSWSIEFPYRGVVGQQRRGVFASSPYIIVSYRPCVVQLRMGAHRMEAFHRTPRIASFQLVGSSVPIPPFHLQLAGIAGRSGARRRAPGESEQRWRGNHQKLMKAQPPQSSTRHSTRSISAVVQIVLRQNILPGIDERVFALDVPAPAVERADKTFGFAIAAGRWRVAPPRCRQALCGKL